MNTISNLTNRLLLLTVAMLGAWIALEGDIGMLEWIFLGAGVLLNEARVFFKLDRWPRLFFALWLTVFLQLPTFYFVYRLYPGFPYSLPNAPLPPDVVLPVAVVAMALPFQVFASYYTNMPRAHHLIMIFALVECVLAAKSGEPRPLWLWMLVLLFVMALAMAFGATQDQLLRDKKARGQESEEIPRSLVLLRFGNFGWLAFGLPLLVLLLLTIFSLMPQKLTQSPSASNDTREAREGDRVVYRGSPETPATPEPENPENPDNTSPFEFPRNVLPDSASGLSPSVDLGGFGRILSDQSSFGSVRVRPLQGEIPQSFLANPKFRIRSFERFDGMSWSSPRDPGQSNSRLNPRKSFDGLSPTLKPLSESAREAHYRHVDVTMTFANSELNERGNKELLVPGELLAVTGFNDGDGTRSRLAEVNFKPQSGESLLVPDDEIAGIRSISYQSAVLRSSYHARRIAEQPRVGKWLQIPEGYSAQIQDEFPVASFYSLRGQPLLLAKALEDYFRNDAGYLYSLENRPSGPDPILDFILDPEQKIGHCEFFATAMVVLLRYFEVPSRLAIGFAPKRNRAASSRGATFSILNSDAHAWVEVRVEGLGWVPFDPTTGNMADKEASTPSRIENSVGPTPNKPDNKREESRKERVDRKSSRDDEDEERALSAMSLDDAQGEVKALASSTLDSFKTMLRDWWYLLVFVLLVGGAWAIRKNLLKKMRSNKTHMSLIEELAGLEATKPKLPEMAVGLLQRFYAACEGVKVKHLASQTPRELASAMTSFVGEEVSFIETTVQHFYAMAYARVDEPETLRLKGLIESDIRRLEGLAQPGL